jgi:hypothetical protein
MSERRTLTYSSLNDVMPDVDRLLQGHRMGGKWTLGQVCYHLSKGIQRSVDGPPLKAPWWMRWFIGPFAKRHIFKTGSMPEGIKIPAVTLDPPDSLDDRAEAEALRATINLFLAAPGPLGKHAMFGKLSMEEWRRFHAIHCAHHLSFAIPT